MTTTTQSALALADTPAQITQASNPMQMIAQAISQGTPPEVIRELVALQQSMERFNWEREERQAKIDFDNALNECQSKISRIAPNQRRENNIAWADYAQIDRIVRPIYIEAGISISFSEAGHSDPSRMRMCATVSRAGVSREYFAEISRTPANGKMNQLDADASAASRVKRYLMLDIFNIAIAIDKDEKKPFTGMPTDDLQDWLKKMRACTNPGELFNTYSAAYKVAEQLGDKSAMFDLIKCNKAEKGRYQ